MEAWTTKSLPRVVPWERSEGQANERVATLWNACSAVNSPRTKPCCGTTSGCRAATLSVKAAVAREETVKRTERTLGAGGATLLDRADVKAGTVLWTSRGWSKRQRLSNADRRSKEERGHRIRAWAHSSEDGGQCLPSEGALGSGGHAAHRSRHTVAGDLRRKRACRAMKQTWRAPRNAGQCLSRRALWEGFMGKVTSPTGSGKSRRPG